MTSQIKQIVDKAETISEKTGIQTHDVLNGAFKAVDGQDPKMDFIEESDQENDVHGIAGKRLLSFIERVERLQEEKAALAEDIKEVYGEAKSVGFDVKTIRQVVKLRKMDTEKRREQEELLDLYKSAVGMA